jgi:hypothetical protein
LRLPIGNAAQENSRENYDSIPHKKLPDSPLHINPDAEPMFLQAILIAKRYSGNEE